MTQPIRSRPAPGDGAPESFPFAFRRPISLLLALVNVRPATSAVVVDTDRGVLDVRFGFWHVRTPLSNVDSAEVDGPYSVWKVVGARLSLADRGLTFGTTTVAGLCITFHRPVPGLLPFGLVRHPSLTVTVADPDVVLARLRAITGRGGRT